MTADHVAAMQPWMHSKTTCSEAKRIQHGFIKATPNNEVQVLGLRHYPETTGDVASQIQRCKEFCETTVSCTVWQYTETEAGTGKGCYLEHAPDHIATGTDPNSTDFVPIAGETIEHTCPPYVEPEGLPWPWIIAGIILGLVGLVALIYFLTKKEPKVKKTRAVKITPPEEPKPVVVMQTVPVPQQSYVVVPPQAPMMMAPAPTYQYQAAPMTTMTAPMTS